MLKRKQAQPTQQSQKKQSTAPPKAPNVFEVDAPPEEEMDFTYQPLFETPKPSEVTYDDEPNQKHWTYKVLKWVGIVAAVLIVLVLGLFLWGTFMKPEEVPTDQEPEVPPEVIEETPNVVIPSRPGVEGEGEEDDPFFQTSEVNPTHTVYTNPYLSLSVEFPSDWVYLEHTQQTFDILRDHAPEGVIHLSKFVVPSLVPVIEMQKYRDRETKFTVTVLSKEAYSALAGTAYFLDIPNALLPKVADNVVVDIFKPVEEEPAEPAEPVEPVTPETKPETKPAEPPADTEEGEDGEEAIDPTELLADIPPLDLGGVTEGQTTMQTFSYEKFGDTYFVIHGVKAVGENIMLVQLFSEEIDSKDSLLATFMSIYTSLEAK